jgi:hypothetical protein
MPTIQYENITDNKLDDSGKEERTKLINNYESKKNNYANVVDEYLRFKLINDIQNQYSKFKQNKICDYAISLMFRDININNLSSLITHDLEVLNYILTYIIPICDILNLTEDQTKKVFMKDFYKYYYQGSIKDEVVSNLFPF